MDGKDHYDNDLSLEELFASVEQTGDLPMTAAPSVLEFVRFFDVWSSIDFLGISSQLSATIQNAHLAAKQLKKPDSYVYDPLNLSTGIGLLALKACDLRGEGKSSLDILSRLLEIRPKVK